jgi:hypothetical protein
LNSNNNLLLASWSIGGRWPAATKGTTFLSHNPKSMEVAWYSPGQAGSVGSVINSGFGGIEIHFSCFSAFSGQR